MGEAVKRIHENTPMSPLFRLEEKNSNKQKRERSCDRSEQLQGAATRLLSQLLFYAHETSSRQNELFFGLFAILC